MDAGTKISVAGHAGLILWAMAGGLFNAPAPRPAPVASDVSLISAEEFAALQPPADVAPQVSQAAPRRPQATPAETAPEAAARPDPAIRQVAPEAEPQAPPDAAPETPTVQPVPAPDVAPAPSNVTPPPTSSDSATLLPGSAPRPREAPRVAPVPAPAPEPDAEVADAVRESVTPDSAAPPDAPREPQEAAAPEAASTRIITEPTETDEDAVEPPAPAAPETSRRPLSRPARPVQTATPEPARPEPEPAQEPAAPRDPIREALAEAQASPAAAPAPARGLSPGAALTGSETDGLRRAISSCWNLGTTSAEAMRTTVVVGVTMKPDGTAEGVRLISSDGPSDGATGIAFDAARRAILRCVGNADLPAAKYDSWSEIEMVFNPDGMRLR